MSDIAIMEDFEREVGVRVRGGSKLETEVVRRSIEGQSIDEIEAWFYAEDAISKDDFVPLSKLYSGEVKWAEFLQGVGGDV